MHTNRICVGACAGIIIHINRKILCLYLFVLCHFFNELSGCHLCHYIKVPFSLQCVNNINRILFGVSIKVAASLMSCER